MKAGDGSIMAASAVASATVRGQVLWNVAGVMGFAFLAALGAQMRIPVPGSDVPMTLQLLAVLMAGLALRPVQAAAAMSVYLATGAAGLPVFTPESAGLLGGTGGYLMGFVPAALLVSAVRGSGDAGVSRRVMACGVGAAVVLGMGVAWKVLWLSGDVVTAVATGLLPFAVKTPVEIGLAVATVGAVRSVISRQGRADGV